LAWEPDISSPRDLIWDKTERSDMPGITLWNLDKAGWDLATEELGEADMFD
jgi:hypothetical protein